MSMLEQAEGAVTLGELLQCRAASTVDPVRVVKDFRPGFTQREEASILLTRGDLYANASRAARLLSERGVVVGEHVLLLLEESEQFLAFFFGCQLLGAVAVPLVPPWSLERLEVHVRRIEKVAHVCSPRATVLSSAARVALTAYLREHLQKDRFGALVSPQELDAFSDAPLQPFATNPEAPAMVQFTSGSTQDARGVLLSHRALLSNCHAIGASLDFGRPEQLGCSWLPLFHDMGLIGHVLVPLLWRIPTVLLPPASFALRPVSWLEAISAYRATISTAPNFAYQMCASKLTPAKTKELDLSSWRVALCGGEPILHDTLTSFHKRFAENGFNEAAFCPVYGLAESSLAVAMSAVDEIAHIERIERSVFAERGEALVCDQQETTLCMVASGYAPDGHQLEVRDDSGVVLGDGVEGEIWVTGPSLMSGYLNDREATERTLVDGWLRTGDRGYLRNGRLFVCGRSKELIIKGGRNLYPQEIEAEAGTVAGIRPGRVAAFAVFDEELGTDRLIVVAELAEPATDRGALELRVMERVSQAIGVRPDVVELLAPGSLTKTSSGKMQRLEAQKRYLNDELHRKSTTFWTRARLLAARTQLLFSK